MNHFNDLLILKACTLIINKFDFKVTLLAFTLKSTTTLNNRQRQLWFDINSSNGSLDTEEQIIYYKDIK